MDPCPHCNDEGVVHDMAGNMLGPCGCAPSPEAIDAAGQRMADTITWLLEALNSATTRDEFDFLVLGAPRELLSVMRSLDPDGLIPDVSSPATSAAGGGSGPYLTASASGDDRQHMGSADLPVAGTSLGGDAA